MADAAAGVGSIEGDGDEGCCVAGAKGERSHMYHTHEMVIVAKECERGPTLESQAGDGRADNEKQPASKHFFFLACQLVKGKYLVRVYTY